MTEGFEVFKALQSLARSVAAAEGRPAPTAELIKRHAYRLLAHLDRLVQLREAGYLSDREFAAAKEKLLF